MAHFNTHSRLGLPVNDLVQVDNTETLYSKIQRIYLKTRLKEERRDLRVTVEILKGNNLGCQQNLSLQITDDDDPFFLFALLLNEDEFKTLKIQQGLLVDFNHFPSQFVRLLECCQYGNDSQGPKYQLIIDEQERDSLIDSRQTNLKIVETNNFKHINHLDLKVGGGSDSEVKKLMALKIRQLKDTVNKNERQLMQTNSQLNDCLQRLELKAREMEQLQQQWAKEKMELLRQNTDEMTKERDKFSSAQIDWQNQMEYERTETKRKHDFVVSNFQQQIQIFAAEHKNLIEKNSQLESSNREKNDRIQALETDVITLHNENSYAKHENRKLEQDHHRLEKHVKMKTALLEQEVADKTTLINEQQERLRVASEEKIRLEESLHGKDCALQRTQASLKSVSEDLLKANTILKTLQSEYVSMNTKLNMRTDIALKQEQVLNRNQQEIARLQAKVAHLEEQSRDHEEKRKNLEESLRAAEAKLEAQEKQLKNNDNEIHWLNRQLSQTKPHTSQVTGTSSTPSYPLSSVRKSALDTMSHIRPSLPTTTPKNVSTRLWTTEDSRRFK